MIYVAATVTLKPNSREGFLAEITSVSSEVRREATALQVLEAATTMAPEAHSSSNEAARNTAVVPPKKPAA